MSSQVRFRRLMFSTGLTGEDAFHALKRLLPTHTLRGAFRSQVPHLGQLCANSQCAPLGTHGEYRWLVTSERAPCTVLLVERADKVHLGVKEGMQIEREARARASGLTGMIILVRPYTMLPESAMDKLRGNMRTGRHWWSGMPR